MMTIIVVISKDPDYQLDDKVSAIACQTVRHIVSNWVLSCLFLPQLLWNIGVFNESKERITEAAHWCMLTPCAVFKEPTLIQL